MNKAELISDIINIFDENTELKHTIELLKQEKNGIPCSQTSEIDQKLIALGRKSLFEKTHYGYHSSVDITRDDETGELIIETYKKWFTNVFRDGEIPVNFSRNEVIEIVEDDFKKLYEENKKKAIEDLKVEG